MKIHASAFALFCIGIAHAGGHFDAVGDEVEATPNRGVDSSFGRRLTGEPPAKNGSHVIPLGNKRPEGTTNGLGATIYVSNFFYGGILSVNVNTGKVKQVVADKEFLERGGIGLSYHNGVLFAGGGGPMGLHPLAEVYVYDAKSGKEIVACEPLEPGLFMNEVTISGGKAYITDSGQAKLMVMDVKSAIKGKCKVSSIDLPDVFDGGEEMWGANGVVPYGDGLIIVHETIGSAYFLDLTDNVATQIIADGEIEFADGALIHRGKLYVTHNLSNKVSVWDLSGGRNKKPLVAEKEGELASPFYGSPATSVIHGNTIYSVNARFDTLDYPHEGEDKEDFAEHFDIVGVRNVFDPNICGA